MAGVSSCSSKVFLFLPPLRLAERKPGGIRAIISRCCLRRNLPFLPGLYRIFIKYSINEFGEEPIFLSVKFFGSSPNLLMAKGLECSKCSVISEFRKRNQIAGNHQAMVSSRLWRGFLLVPLKFFFSYPRCALRNTSPGDSGKNIPPLLAAQSAFPSGPLPSFHRICDQRIWRRTLALYSPGIACKLLSIIRKYCQQLFSYGI